MALVDLPYEFGAAQNWEVRLQVTYLAPTEPADPSLPIDIDLIPPPRTNIVVSRVSTQQTDPAVECRNFIQQTATAVPGLEEIGSPSPLDFNDGVKGVVTQVSFPASDRIKLTQLHAFRIDKGILTQLVATIDETQSAQKLDELRHTLQSFTPK